MNDSFRPELRRMQGERQGSRSQVEVLEAENAELREKAEREKHAADWHSVRSEENFNRAEKERERADKLQAELDGSREELTMIALGLKNLGVGDDEPVSPERGFEVLAEKFYAQKVECEGLREKLEALREVVELECDALASFWSQQPVESNGRRCIQASETRLMGAARAAAPESQGGEEQ